MPVTPRGFFWSATAERDALPAFSSIDIMDVSQGASLSFEPTGPQAFQPPTSGTAPNGLPIFSWDQAAVQITRDSNGWAGDPAIVTYAFRATSVGMPNDISGFSQFTAAQITAAEEALALWAEVANIVFVRVGSGTSGPQAYSNSATILFGNYSTGADGAAAFAFYPGSTSSGAVDGDVWINVSLPENQNMTDGTYGPHTLIHEIGHAIGLAHPGDYDALDGTDPTYETSAEYWQDARMFSVMSYFGSTNTGGSLNGFSSGPQLHDIAAAQLLYGANMSTRTGDTIYGFNSNTGHAHFSLTTGVGDDSPVFAIWDAGGNDTLDLSGYGTDSEIDLRPEAFSSAGPGNSGVGVAVGNISIARGVIIENAIGGGGNDTMIGNSAANTLTGNGGADTMAGGLGNDVLNGGPGGDSMNGEGGVDTVTYVGASTGVIASLAAPGGNTGDAAGDTYTSIENLTGSNSADTLTGDGGDNVLSGLNGADIISGGAGNDTLYGHSAGAAATITAAIVTSGLSTPVGATSTPADPGFMYVIEKDTGVIWRTNLTTGAHTTFLDIPQGEFTRDGERGLLGIAFHPDYATNGRFFVYLTDATGDLQVREYHRSAGNPAVADTTFTIIWETPHATNNNHNGGWIGFSPVDGYLYINTGDGGGGGDTDNNAQNLNSYLGKILRIDVNSDAFPGDASRNYAIPAANPFAGATAGLDEIWAYGLRNPFRAAFDPRNGNFYIGDVGQSAREEVDFLAAGVNGANLGWRIMEGNLPFNPGGPGTPQPGDPSLTNPVYDYGRTVGTTVTGGEVYTGSVAGFVGQYVFADFGSNRLFTLQIVNGVAVDVAERTAQIAGVGVSSIVDFATDNTGALYAIGIFGQVWRLTPGEGAADVGDTLDGGAGNDRLVGGAGNDTLIGGANIDTSQYAIAATGASWVRTLSGAWTVTAGAEGTDTLTGVEILDFTDRDVVLDNAQQSFYGNGASDILWRNLNDGQVAIWEMNGATQTNALVVGTGANPWTIVNTGDFGGDGRDDILWRNSSDGQVLVWRDANWQTASFYGAVASSWVIAGVGDFNFDGRDDFLWRNTSDGLVGIWLLDGATSLSQGVIGAAPLNWSIVGVADFDGDGRDDILWRQDTGLLARWTTNGAAQTGANIIGNVPTEWVVAGTGDFDGDARADILWRNTLDGSVAIWRMNGDTRLDAGNPGGAPLSWHIVDVGDYNADGKDDILWRNDDGTLALWTMNGFTATAQIVGGVPTEWGII